MRWLCFLLLLAEPARAPAPGPKPLRFDLAALPATRDSFVFFFKGARRGYAVWQYEIRSLEMGQVIVFTAHAEFQPVAEEELRMTLNRLTGEPLSSFHHVVLLSPESDTVMQEHDLEVTRGVVAGQRKVGMKNGDVKIVPVDQPLAPGVVWASYGLYAAAVTNAVPGDSLAGPAYREFEDRVVPLVVVAGPPQTLRVPAGRFDVVPLRSGAFRLYVTRGAPRRVVRGESLDSSFRFVLATSRPVVPSLP